MFISTDSTVQDACPPLHCVLQVVTQKLTLNGVVPPSKDEPFEVLFEASRSQESATPLHLPFTAETQPIAVRPMQHDPKQGISMEVRESQPSNEQVDGVPLVAFALVCSPKRLRRLHVCF